MTGTLSIAEKAESILTYLGSHVISDVDEPDCNILCNSKNKYEDRNFKIYDYVLITALEYYSVFEDSAIVIEYMGSVVFGKYHRSESRIDSITYIGGDWENEFEELYKKSLEKSMPLLGICDDN